MNNETIERFWSHVNKSAGCWEWTASKRNKGYGAFVWHNNGIVVQGRAHRFSWELHNGEIPGDLCVLHKCDNPACVRPDHLFLGTKAENNLDMRNKGRHVAGGTKLKERGENGKYPTGEKHHNAKLTEEIVRKIRADYPKLSFSKISQKYHISSGHAFRIVTKGAWKNV